MLQVGGFAGTTMKDSARGKLRDPDRVPVHSRLEQASDVSSSDDTPRSNLALPAIARSVQGHKARVPATSTKTKSLKPSMKPKTTIRPRSAIEGGASVDELFYRTYMRMQDSLATEQHALAEIKNQRKVSNSLVRLSVGESAMWFTARRSSSLNPQPSARTRRSLCNFKAAVAFLILHARVTRTRKLAREDAEKQERLDSEVGSERQRTTEETLGDQAAEKLLGVLNVRIKAEKLWLAEREQQRLKPLTDLMQARKAAQKECKSWPDRINELQFSRKQALHIERRSELLFQQWWKRSRAACGYVWPDGENPFGVKAKAGKALRKTRSSQSPQAGGARAQTPTRVSWSGHSQRSGTLDTQQRNPAEQDKLRRDLPDLTELFRKKLFDSDGDMSYKTLDFLKRSKQKHITDRIAFTKEAGELEKEFKVLSDAADAELVPHEAKHSAELSKIDKKLAADKSEAEAVLKEPRRVLEEKDLELEAFKDKFQELAFAVEKTEAELQAVYGRVHDLDEHLNQSKVMVSFERQRLRQLLASRRAANALNMSADFAKEGRREHMLALEAKVADMKADLAAGGAARAEKRRSMLQVELEAVRFSAGFVTDKEVAAEYRRMMERIEEVRRAQMKAEEEQERERLRHCDAAKPEALMGGGTGAEGGGRGANAEERPSSSRDHDTQGTPLHAEQQQSTTDNAAAGAPETADEDGTSSVEAESQPPSETSQHSPAIPDVAIPSTSTPRALSILSAEEVYAVVAQYVDSAEDDVSLAEAAAHVHVRYPWVERSDWEGRLEGVYEAAFAAAEERAATVTPEEELRLVRLELSDYGYAPDEMEGFELAELREMLQREKGA